MNQQNPAQQRRSRLIAAVKGQQREIETLKQTNAALVGHVGTLTQTVASLAAMNPRAMANPRVAALVRNAGIKVAEDTNNSSSYSKDVATTTEQAAKPDATDNVEGVGAAPAPANVGVTPEGVTDVNSTDVSANPPVLDNLQNVTAPVSGTDSPTPAAGDAGGASTVTVGTPSQETSDKGNGWGVSTSSKGGDQERFVASMRLARLRVASKIEEGEDLAIAQRIASSSETLGEINAQVTALSAVASRQAQAPSPEQARRLVPQKAATRGQGIAPLGQPSMQAIAAQSETRQGEDEWMVGGVEG